MSQVNVDRIKSRAGTGSPTFTNGLVCSGVGTFSSQVSIAGTLTYEDVTNVDSVGIVTGRLGLRASGGGLDVVGVSTLTAAQADVATFTSNQSASVVYVKDSDGDGILISGSSLYGHRIYTTTTEDLLLGTNTTERVRITSAGRVGIGTDNVDSRLEVVDTSGLGIISRSAATQATDSNKGLKVRNNSTTDTFNVSYKGQGYFAGNVGIKTDSPAVDLHVQDGSGTIRVESTSDATSARIEILGKNNSYAGLHMGDTDDVDVGGLRYYNTDNFLQIRTNASERVRITSTGGLTLSNGELIEKCHIQSSPAWSSNGAVDLDNGVVQYNTTNYGSGGAGSLYFTSSVGINTQMATGDIMSLTMMTNVNSTAGYINNIFIDGQAATETWVGGSAPTAGGGSGVDIYTFNIIKTASATYTVIANQIKTS